MNEIDPDADDVTNRIIGAAFEVSNILGAGFLEVVYRKALAKELKLRDLDARQEVPFRVVYKGDEVGTYFADLIVENQVVVELKALEVLSPRPCRASLELPSGQRIEGWTAVQFRPAEGRIPTGSSLNVHDFHSCPSVFIRVPYRGRLNYAVSH